MHPPELKTTHPLVRRFFFPPDPLSVPPDPAVPPLSRPTVCPWGPIFIFPPPLQNPPEGTLWFALLVPRLRSAYPPAVVVGVFPQPPTFFVFSFSSLSVPVTTSPPSLMRLPPQGIGPPYAPLVKCPLFLVGHKCHLVHSPCPFKEPPPPPGNSLFFPHLVSSPVSL